MEVQKPFFDELKRDEGNERLREGCGLEDSVAVNTRLVVRSAKSEMRFRASRA